MGSCNLKTKNKRLNIGFFTCHLDNDYAYEVCKGVDLAAKELDVNLIVFPGMYMNASYNDAKNAKFDYQYNSIFYYASKNTLDALIVSIGTIGSFLAVKDMIAFLKNFDVPIITIEIEIPGYPCVYTEGKTGMRQAVEHLIKEHNVTKIGLVSGRKDNADAKDRLDTYCAVLKENNIPVNKNRIVYGDFSEYTEGIVHDLLDRNPDLEAIVFANDQMAIGGYNAIKEKGLEIGKDILVTGYDDSPASIVLEPMLTTVHNKTMDMGYQAVKEVVKLATTGETNIKVLGSNLIVRSSCGCGNYKLTHQSDKSISLNPVKNSDKLIEHIEDYLFHSYSDTLIYNQLIFEITPLIKLIIDPIVVTCDLNFNMEAIKSEASKLFDSPLTNYFSRDKLINSIKELNKLLIALASSEAMSNSISIMFNDLLALLVYKLSNILYNEIRHHKTSIWSSMYITRDTLTSSDDEEACYHLIMEKLEDSHFISSYMYIYDDPVMLLPNGTWKIPKTLFLQACDDMGHITYLSEDDRLISSDQIFFNKYTSYDRRRTLVLTPLFTNNIQYGLFVGEIDVSNFSNVYPNTLQLATSLNFISLMKQQLSAQKKLKHSADELNEKNALLNKLSITDSLTGINNRRGVMDSIKRQVNFQLNSGKQAMLVFADMDNLKQVNDVFGHKDGDFALKSIANILTDSFDEGDIVGRLGGDEFIAFAFLDNPAKPDNIRNAIREASKKLNDTCGKPYYIDMSLGICTFVCSPNLNVEEMLHHADDALYESKKNKRTNVVKKD